MKWILGAGILAASSAFALVEKTIDEKHPVEVVFSTDTHNRISVEGGAVEKVFGDTALFSVNIDPATGNAFINVLKEIEKPAALTVVTSSGAAQDLLVSSKEGPSERVWLKEAEGEEWTIRPALSHGSAIEFLNEVIDGKVPSGYGERDWEESETLDLPAPLVVTRLKALEGPFESLCVYRIQNPEYKTVVVDPEALKKGPNTWVFVNAQKLKMGTETLCIIGTAKDGNEN